MSEPSPVPTPRETFAYEHGEALDRAFATAFEKGRLHHAWLLCGPQGLGKASFAFAARAF